MKIVSKISYYSLLTNALSTFVNMTLNYFSLLFTCSFSIHINFIFLILKKKKKIVSEIYPTFLEGVMTILLQTVWSSIICLRKNEFKISLLVLSICFLSLVSGSYSLVF